MQRNIRKSEAIDNARFSFFMFRLSLSLLIFDNSSTLFFEPAYDVCDDRRAIDISQVMIPALKRVGTVPPTAVSHRAIFRVQTEPIRPRSHGLSKPFFSSFPQSPMRWRSFFVHVIDVFQSQFSVGTTLDPGAEDARNLSQIGVRLAHDLKDLFLAELSAAPRIVIGRHGNFLSQGFESSIYTP